MKRRIAFLIALALSLSMPFAIAAETRTADIGNLDIATNPHVFSDNKPNEHLKLWIEYKKNGATQTKYTLKISSSFYLGSCFTYDVSFTPKGQGTSWKHLDINKNELVVKDDAPRGQFSISIVVKQNGITRRTISGIPVLFDNFDGMSEMAFGIELPYGIACAVGPEPYF